MAPGTRTQPDVLLIVVDALRADHLSCYGYDRPTTPRLDRLAEETTLYERAFSTTSWTPPAHASMFTGLYPSRHGTIARPNLQPDVPTITEALRDAGYATMGVVQTYPVGGAAGFARGFDRFFSPFEAARPSLPLLGQRALEFTPEFLSYLWRRATQGYDASWRNMLKLRRWLAAEDRPTFGFINLHSVHGPYRPPRSYAGRFATAELRARADVRVARRLATGGGYEYMTGGLQAGEHEWALVRAWYDEEIAYADMLVSRLVESLRRRRRYHEALIIITSDHGEHFGEQGLAFHGFALDDALLRVPLMIKWPGDEGAGVRDDRLVSLVDLASTIAQVTGVELPGEVDGRSLADSDVGHDAVFAEFHPSMLAQHTARMANLGRPAPERLQRALQAVRTERHKLVRGADGTVALYDLAADPAEQCDISAGEPELVAALQARMDVALLPPERWPPWGEEEYDDTVASHLRHLGYL